MSEDITKYQDQYGDIPFWKKVIMSAGKAGSKLIENALAMYYSAKDKDTPKWARTVIYGALGYFIMPIDAIPDFTPALGYSDDLAAILAAIGVVAMYMKDEHREKAKQKISKLF